jgi:hypothetical protein
LHGLPTSIIIDRDPVFTSNFWKELLKLLGIKMNMSLAYHPQTERVNQCLENYLRSMLIDQPQRWTRWLLLAQWWYNSCFHCSLKTSPFQSLYGYPPPLSSLGHPPHSQIAVVDTLLRDQHHSLTQLRANLTKAQNSERAIEYTLNCNHTDKF